ncbi:MAG: hypothetical protein R3D26_15565 [Cyanobacteriota/Melainabacteria group bacterium]
MDKLANLFGLFCAAINGILISLSVVHAALVGVCFAMMQIDKNPVCTWNCGVLIYGSEAVVLFLVALPFYFLAKFSLWTNPLKSTTWIVAAASGFLLSAGCYGYGFLDHFRTCVSIQ